MPCPRHGRLHIGKRGTLEREFRTTANLPRNHVKEGDGFLHVAVFWSRGRSRVAEPDSGTAIFTKKTSRMFAPNCALQ
jgi:hypothetical protein